MGGGDLNLKKSWHPNTMKNQEKVWKAEQIKTQEEKKVNDLRKEIEEEKNREELQRIGRDSGVLAGSREGDKKLDWMYKNSSELINREEYLLGRKIDKSFEVLHAEEKEREQQNLIGVKQPLNHVEHDCVPFSIRTYKNIENSEQVDLQRKVMEDPLMLIKQREMESRRKILENPVKLKELHRILKTDEKLRKLSRKSKKLKKSKKVKKPKKKNRSSSSESSLDSDSDLDTKLAKKLKSGLLNRDETSDLGLSLTKLLDTKFKKISKELDNAAGKRKKIKDTDTKYNSDKRRRSRSSSEQREFRKRNEKFRSVSRDSEKSKKIDERRFESSRKQSTCFKSISKSRNSNEKEREKNNLTTDFHSQSCSGVQNYRNRMESTSSKEHRYTHKSRRSRSKFNDRKKSYRDKPQSPALHNSREKLDKSSSTNKLTDEEKQAKLKEMMSNAAWREEERTEVVRKHRETYAKEEEIHRAQEFDRNFLNKEVKKAMANQTSVGSRLRANLNNIQRTSTAMDVNFARK